MQSDTNLPALRRDVVLHVNEGSPIYGKRYLCQSIMVEEPLM